MRNFIPILFVLALFLSACSATYQGSAALYDDVYYSSAEIEAVNDVVYESPQYYQEDYEYEGDDYTEESNIPDSTHQYLDEDRYEIYTTHPYSARILRFHGSSGRMHLYDYYNDYARYRFDNYWEFYPNYMSPFYGYRMHYNGYPYNHFDWGWGVGFGWDWNFGFNLGFSLGWPHYNHYGYGGYGGYYHDYGNFYTRPWGNSHRRNVNYGHRNSRGQINSSKTIRTPRDARGYNKSSRVSNGSRAVRGSRTVTPRDTRNVTGSSGTFQKQDARTTPTRTRSGKINAKEDVNKRGRYSRLNNNSQVRKTTMRTTSTRNRKITDNANGKSANVDNRTQRINSTRQRYQKTSPRYKKPGTYQSTNKQGRSSRQYTSPQKYNRSTTPRYTNERRTTSNTRSLRQVTKPINKSVERRSIKSQGKSSYSTKRPSRTYSTKSRSKSNVSRSYSSGSRSSGSKSSGSSSGSSGSGSRRKR